MNVSGGMTRRRAGRAKGKKSRRGNDEESKKSVEAVFLSFNNVRAILQPRKDETLILGPEPRERRTLNIASCGLHHR